MYILTCGFIKNQIRNIVLKIFCIFVRLFNIIFMKEQIKEALKEMFKNNEIQVFVNIEPEFAPEGDGQWNVSRVKILIDDDIVYENEGMVDIIEAN
jgi:hypothetical protein